MKETIEQKYLDVVANNPNVIKAFLQHVLTTCNISIDKLKNNEAKYIKLLLEKHKTYNKRLLRIREDRKQIESDLTSLERSFVSADCLEVRETTTTNHVNTIEKRQILKLKLKEELFNNILESKLLEKSLLDNNNVLIEYINIIPRQQYIDILEMTYTKCMTNVYIADKLNYSISNVDQARLRGVYDMSRILNIFVNKSK